MGLLRKGGPPDGGAHSPRHLKRWGYPALFMMEFQTSAYRTKTIIQGRNNSKILSDYWPIGIDVGYSAVKCFSPIWCVQFPSYAEKISSENTLGELPSSYILYTDLETDEKWVVGERAQDTVSARSSNASDNALFGRDRYYSKLFLVIIRTGLGMVMRSSNLGEVGGRKIKIQTGLPPAYQKEDSKPLRESFVGRHHFSLKVGSSKPVEFDFTISPEDVSIVAQPFGTLYTVTFDNTGHIPLGHKDYLNKRTLIFDPGFGTFDLFSIKKNQIGDTETFSDLGMKQVLKNTIDRISDEYGVSYSIPAFQQCLETGTVTVLDRRARSSKEIPFGEILAEESEKVCQAAIDRVFDTFNLAEYDYLIITGGTSAAWKDIIKRELANMQNLSIVSGNINDTSLPLTFANVRGYYYFLFVNLLRQG